MIKSPSPTHNPITIDVCIICAASKQQGVVINTYLHTHIYVRAYARPFKTQNEIVVVNPFVDAHRNNSRRS